MRSIWTDSIGFGLVSIPIPKAVKSDDLSDQLMSSLADKKGA